MAYSENFQTILDRINHNKLKPVVFDLTSVDGNAFSLMGHWKNAARKADWQQEDIDIVLKECTSGDYYHLVATLLEVSASEPDEDEDDYDSEEYDYRTRNDNGREYEDEDDRH